MSIPAYPLEWVGREEQWRPTRTIPEMDGIQAPVLDLGCGPEPVASLFFPPSRVIGYDINHVYSRLLRKRGFNAIQGDVRFLPFRDETFFTVFLRHILTHLMHGDDRGCLLEVKRIMKRGGYGYIEVLGTEDARYGKGEEIDTNTFLRKDGRIWHFYGIEEISHLVQDTGFSVEKSLEDRIKMRKTGMTRHFIKMWIKK